MAKEFRKADYSTFQHALDVLGVTADSVCMEIGYSASAWNAWKAEGKMPYVVSVAVECLLRRQNQAGRISGAVLKSAAPVTVVAGKVSVQKLPGDLYLIQGE